MPSSGPPAVGETGQVGHGNCHAACRPGTPLAGQVSTNGGEKLVSEPLITGKNPPSVKLSHESYVSTTQTEVEDTPHACSVTPSWRSPCGHDTHAQAGVHPVRGVLDLETPGHPGKARPGLCR